MNRYRSEFKLVSVLYKINGFCNNSGFSATFLIVATLQNCHYLIREEKSFDRTFVMIKIDYKNLTNVRQLLHFKDLPMSRRSSPLETEKCRQCSSFSDYMKTAKRKAIEESNGEVSSTTNSLRTDCPLDKDELGRSSWGLLHTMAAKYPDKPNSGEQKEMKAFFHTFAKFYPCDHCAEDMRNDFKVDPPETASQEALSQWLCRFHNRVNTKLGRKQFDCTKVNERWRDGWADGSCDY